MGCIPFSLPVWGALLPLSPIFFSEFLSFESPPPILCWDPEMRYALTPSVSACGQAGVVGEQERGRSRCTQCQELKGKFLLREKVEGRGKSYSWCHAVKEGLGYLIESLSTGKIEEHVHFWVPGYVSLCIWSVCIPVQAYLGDIMGSVPDHCDKVNIAIKWHTTFLLSQCI